MEKRRRTGSLGGTGTDALLTPVNLEVAAHGLTAVLGAWLGLTLLTRSRTPAARVFGFLSLALVAWSASIIVERLSNAPAVAGPANAIEELAAALVIPATAHFSLVIATEGHPSRPRRRLIVLAYLLNMVLVLPGVVDRGHPVAISEPNFSLGPLSGFLLGSAWIAVRAATLGAGAWWLVRALQQAPLLGGRRRQLAVTLATVGIGALGGLIRVLNVIGPSDPWIGVSLVTLAMVLSASVVFGAGVFFAPEVARRAFWRSLAFGFGLFGLVGVLVGLDVAGRRLLGLDLPVFAIMAVVVVIALYEPAVGWGRSRLAGHPATVARGRLMTALGAPALASRPASEGVQPALARLVHSLGLTGAQIRRADGSSVAVEGTVPPSGPRGGLPLLADAEEVGRLFLGPTLSGVPLTAADEGLLRLSAAYLASAIRTSRREDEQVAALAGLSIDRADVESSALRLHHALVRHSSGRPGLHVFALGAFRVERAGEPIRRWGGEKAGSRQAQALFAFLFDRGERGVAKDEALELLWPDVEIERADLAFHRTLRGLRHALDPAGGGRTAIRFGNDRYRLDGTVVEWSDLADFIARLDEARTAGDDAARVAHLEAARAIWRGEYLDDCPFYGDSAHVEERRTALRARFVDVLLALGAAYEGRGDTGSARAAYRDAITTAPDGCAQAETALARPGG